MRSEKAEKTLALSELSETMKGLRESLGNERKELANRSREQQTQLLEGFKRMEQMEAYLQSYAERLKNGVLGIPDLN